MWVDSGYFFAGIIFRDGVAIRTAPILKYTLGWHQDRVTFFCLKKKWLHGLLTE